MNSSTPTFVCIFYYFLCQQALIIAAWVACVFLFWLALPVTRLHLECKTNEVVIVMWSTLSFQYLRSKQIKTLDLAFNLLMYVCMPSLSFRFSIRCSKVCCTAHCLSCQFIYLSKEGFQLAIFFTIFLSSIHEPIVWLYCLLNMKFKYLIKLSNYIKQILMYEFQRK